MIDKNEIERILSVVEDKDWGEPWRNYAKYLAKAYRELENAYAHLEEQRTKSGG